jgi:HEAT repeat protein
MTPLFAAALLLASGPGGQSGLGRAADRQKQPAAEAAPDSALSDEEVESRVKTFLGAIDTPIPAAHWKALGARGAALLSPLAKDPAQFPTRRAKAVDGLSAIAPQDAEPLFAALAAGETEPLVVRLSALRGLGQVVPAKRLQVVLHPLLTGAKAYAIRAGAAEVLSAKGQGCAAVEAQLKRETAELRGAYHRAAKSCADLKAKAE